MRILKPVEPPFEPEVEEILSGYPLRDGYVLNLFRVFANSVRFLKKGTNNLLDRQSPLSMRQRELVILRTCANNGCEYEWGVHVGAFAEHVGFSADQIAATTSSDLSVWEDADERLLVEVVDELCRAGTLSEEVKAGVQKTWTEEQQLEIMALCGNYHTVSFVANVADVSREDFAARFPA